MRYLILILLCVQFAAKAQNQVLLQTEITIQAREMVTAFESADYEALLDYTYPKIFEISGGRNVMLQMIQEIMQAMDNSGYRIDSARVGMPGQVYQAGAELHAIISQYVYMSIPGGTMVNESCLLAVSQDGGNKWYFLDTQQLDAKLKPYFFPQFNNELVIPEPKDPVLNYD